jgi:hypothetical protein
LGTFTPHLMLEKDLENLYDQSALIYSSYYTTIQSSILSVAPELVYMFKNELPEIQRLKESNKVIEVDDINEIKHDKSISAIFVFSKNVIEALRFCDKNFIRTLLVDSKFCVDKKVGIIDEL